ncbi:MAG TPA: hypothetical protein VNI54_17920 [Thermoanaerobaculia bacterium]|nr:hypothetical protein [Thermoanaerobaculia bacterium]
MRHLAIALALTLAATAAFAHDSAEDCSDKHFRFGKARAFVKQETIDAGSLRSLKLSVKNAPISVEGGASAYSITVCKAAEVEADLSAIRVVLEGNELKTYGPDRDDDRNWTVTYHVRVPRGADLDLSAKNGPLSIHDVDGKVMARLHNGPLALRNVGGNVDAETQNGPISISGGSGTIKASASNGPLSVNLAGGSFNGTLDASTKNGPLTVKLPRDYSSGVVVESKGRGPISCRAEGCAQFLRNHDDDSDEPRRIELGSGPVNVRLSTVNGPVTVKDE